MGALLFHADGCIGMAKLIVDFRNFANTPKKDTRNEGLYTIWGQVSKV